MKNKVSFFQSVGLKIILVYIFLLLITIELIGVYFDTELERNMERNFQNSIENRIQLLTYSLEEAFTRERTEEDPTLQAEVQSILSEFDSQDITELQVIDSQMRIIGTTNQFNRSIIGKITTREDVQRLFSFRTQLPYRKTYDQETGTRTLTNTIPVFNQSDEIIGAIFVEASMEDVFNQLDSITKIFMNGTIIALSITVVIGILVSRTITKPISEMRKQAHVVAGGDFSKKVNVYAMDEIGQLANSFNHMTERLKESYADTEEERRKLTSVLSNMNEGVIASNRKGEIILMNEQAGKFIGESFEKIKGHNVLSVLGIEEDFTSVSEVENKASVLIDFSNDQQTLLIKATFSIIYDETETVSGFITVLNDVTEEEKIEQDRREFVANVSHELRTPLTTMSSYLEALTDEDTLNNPDIAPKFLSVTQNETERMIRLVNDLLQLSKLDNDENYLRKEKVNFINFFHNIIDRFEMNKYEQDLSFVRRLPNKSYWVWIDKDKMTQVLDNVLSNAIKYSPEGGTITCKVEIKNKMLQVNVSDQGVGIPKEQVDRIFDRFYRVDKARSRKLGGTGLGLAIAREMIEAHDGRIWAESKEGKGTTIKITLPMMHQKRGDA
ncbi:two-component system, OmpR family, sensor histidine kinase VicK [Salinibacillus kushneri]|uniref:histidine kinase n=1 Tax=Salinibacillus kushneri TaxID=237682 RepID=A0A1I0C855_9BACI|nr:cell wall metabolism sensor histidine kinase WalK [Salinibacillus kushneri]SET15726.1 two-component system, OmpR family, sensor histidine kinase VicK [Salinibacillus kushneri]